LTRKLAAHPGLAENWEISPDGRIYTFHLRTNLTWSTGEPITAGDVVYSWIRALNPATASVTRGRCLLKNAKDFNAGKIKDASLVGVQALDKFTVRFDLDHPTAFFPDVCAMPVAGVVPQPTIEKQGDRWLMAKRCRSAGRMNWFIGVERQDPPAKKPALLGCGQHPVGNH